MIAEMVQSIGSIPLTTWFVGARAAVAVAVLLHLLTRLHLWAQGRALTKRLQATEATRTRLRHELTVLQQHAECAARFHDELTSGTVPV